MENSTHVYHLYVVRVQNRENIIELLNSKGIGVGIHYPTPLPFLEAYNYKNHQKTLFFGSVKMLHFRLSKQT